MSDDKKTYQIAFEEIEINTLRKVVEGSTFRGSEAREIANLLDKLIVKDSGDEHE